MLSNESWTEVLMQDGTIYRLMIDEGCPKYTNIDRPSIKEVRVKNRMGGLLVIMSQELPMKYARRTYDVRIDDPKGKGKRCHIFLLSQNLYKFVFGDHVWQGQRVIVQEPIKGHAILGPVSGWETEEVKT